MYSTQDTPKHRGNEQMSKLLVLAKTQRNGPSHTQLKEWESLTFPESELAIYGPHNPATLSETLPIAIKALRKRL